MNRNKTLISRLCITTLFFGLFAIFTHRAVIADNCATGECNKDEMDQEMDTMISANTNSESSDEANISEEEEEEMPESLEEEPTGQEDMSEFFEEENTEEETEMTDNEGARDFDFNSDDDQN